MGLDIENGALGAEYEQQGFVTFFLQNSTDWETELRISLPRHAVFVLYAKLQ